MKKIDCYTHFASEEMVSFMEEKTGKPMVFRDLFSRIPTLTNTQARIEMMDQYDIDAHCIIPLPWLESSPEIHANPEWASSAARLSNVHFSRLSKEHPGRFHCAALIPTTNAEVMMAEVEFALSELGMAGLALFCGPTVRPLDDPFFEPLWAAAAAAGAPVWLHPCRPQFVPDYDAYRAGGSKYQIWNTLGWIYDTSVAMVHIAQAGVFQRHPDVKIVTHHHGGMVPFFAERFHTQAANFNDDAAFVADLAKFYCDTATFGEVPLNVRQALDFFGPDRVMFGTDSPLDMSAPGAFTTTGIACIEKLGLAEGERAKVYHRNCEALLARK
ncbi:unnamed protein product, partial [Heterosigma akashiwo]